MFSFLQRLFWFAIAMVLAYTITVVLKPNIADSIAQTLGIPPSVNETIRSWKSGVQTFTDSVSQSGGSFTLSGAKDALNKLNTTVKPYVEQAVSTTQKVLSGAQQVQQTIQEKQRQINELSSAVQQVSSDIQNLSDKAKAVTTFSSGTTTAPGVQR